MVSQIPRFSLPIWIVCGLSLCLRLFFLGNHDLLTEEAYYWNYSVHLDFGYLDHPPMVAVLIKLFTTLFGVNEFSVRCPALVCWGLTAYFMYRWAELIQTGSGQFSVLLLSILPFFFLNSCITTPDMPLLAAWAAALYYLYQVLCMHKSRAWYGAGISIGLGLLAKYSIALLIMTTGLCLLVNPEHRLWLRRKEPYYAAVLILIVFSPVIYWNAAHHWMSFSFQSTRRLEANFYFSLHHLIGILILFLTPIGLIGCMKLFKRADRELLTTDNRRFILSFTCGPLLVFALFSCFRAIKLDWIGPPLLAVLPWLGCVMAQQRSILQQWLRTSPILIGSYSFILVCLTYGLPVLFNQKLFSPSLSVSWQALTHDLYQIASDSHTQPILMPLDTYRVESELVFYQAKQWQSHPNLHPFPVHHAAKFGFNGLMFELWDMNNLQGKTVILITTDRHRLDNDFLRSGTQLLSPIHMVWGKSQNLTTRINPYYYQIARIL